MRERAKGLPRAPEAEEFREINEYMAAKNAWREESEKRRQNEEGTTLNRARTTTAANAGEEENELEDVLMLDVTGETLGQGAGQRLGRSVSGRGNQDEVQGGTIEAACESEPRVREGPVRAIAGDKACEGEVNSSLPSPSGIREGAAWTMVQFQKNVDQRNDADEMWGGGSGRYRKFRSIIGSV